MNIRHERPMPDLAFRMQAPIGLTLRDGTRVPVADWSMKGVHAPDLVDRDHTSCILSIPFQGIVLSFPVTLQHTSEPGHYEFQNMNGRQRETLGLFYRSLLSGKMASTADMITSLDTPVDLIPMEETEEERFIAEEAQMPRSIRATATLAVYVLLFMMIFGFLSNFVWTNLNEISLTQARFAAPIEQLAAPKGAFVRSFEFSPGQPVKAGDVVVRLADPEGEGVLSELKFEVDEADRSLEEVRQRIARHEDGRAVARRSLETALESAVEDRRPQDFFGGYDLQETTLAYDRLKSFDLGVSLEPQDFNAVRQQLIDLRESKKLALRNMRREMQSSKDSLDSLRILAPRDGTVDAYFVQPTQYLRAGTPILDFEGDTPRSVVGFLDHRHATNVFEGMPAKIRFNQNGETFDVDATVTKLEAGPSPTAPHDFGMIVTLEANDLNLYQARAAFDRNAPVEAILDRELLGGFLGP